MSQSLWDLIERLVEVETVEVGGRYHKMHEVSAARESLDERIQAIRSALPDDKRRRLLDGTES